ncbi:hypothetical protein DOJK_01018 [Patescibacteria group bacterium]|nr:hypothetical protein DOJK_01018 [Patescibacteria group bacterium]
MTLTAREVAEFLEQQPDFFEHHLELLEKLTIPHPSGAAVSLLSKQVELLRDKHREQENRLADLVSIARSNDAMFVKLHELTLTLLDYDRIEDLMSVLAEDLNEYFSTDFVEVRLIQPCPDKKLARWFIEPSSETVKPFLKELGVMQPRCARPTLAQAKVLFGDHALEVNSCAMIPMMIGNYSGLLAIASREAGRFHYSMGQLFLTQLGELVSARLHSLLRLMT